MSDARRDNDQNQGRTTLLDRMRNLLGLSPASLRDDIEDALEQPQNADDFSPQERVILRNVLELHEHRVRDIMIPRADIVAVGITATLAEVLTMFRTAGHSRLPVHGDTLDDPRGMIHIRDFVDYLAGAVELGMRRRKRSTTEAAGVQADIDSETIDKRSQRLAAVGALDLSTELTHSSVIRPVLFVPPSMPALDLLVKMQATRTHMALVIDEYGGTEGLVSIEDVVEMIVGDIEDEHDEEEEPRIEQVGEKEYLVDARADPAVVSERTGIDMTALAESEEVDTIGGLIASEAGRVPARGEIIRLATLGLEFEIVDADPRRITRVRIRLTQPDSSEQTDTAQVRDPGQGSAK
ncbi:MAG: hemolysin family protein [Methylobacteriaceae bacterium]|nr:hemolysin family protein [Methylobacteriaceae bacterium]